MTWLQKALLTLLWTWPRQREARKQQRRVQRAIISETIGRALDNEFTRRSLQRVRR